jgi:MarR family transcriptional regulator, transcriptional regulator for hemolysin
MSQSPEPPEENLGWLLSTVSHALATEFTAGLEAVSITPRAHCVLATALGGEYTQSALAQALGVDKTTMVVTIDALEQAGLAERRPSSGDRRARVITVTEAGRQTVAEGERIVRQIQEDVLASLSPGSRAAFMDALLELVHGRLATPAECAHPVRKRAPRRAPAPA